MPWIEQIPIEKTTGLLKRLLDQATARTAPLSSVDRALCAFAARLTGEQSRVRSSDLGSLRMEGLDDRGIHDTVQVIALFNYYTRLADGLGVEPETGLPTWGEHRPDSEA